MTDAAPFSAVTPSIHTGPTAAARLRRRYAAERRFRLYGLAAVVVAMTMLALLLTSIASKGIGAFRQSELALTIQLNAETIDPKGNRDPAEFDRAPLQELVQQALYATFPDVTSRIDRRALRGLVSPVAGVALARQLAAQPELVGTTARLWLPVSDEINQLAKGGIDRSLPEASRVLNDRQIGWYEVLSQRGDIRRVFNRTLLTAADSNYPELAGIWGAMVGSIYTLMVTLILALPIGVATALYLEEFAPRHWLSDLIEVNINNLAAVPSIIFGLLGLAVFLQFFGLPRSAPLVGGLVMTLMSLPTIIIASRAALKAVPPSIREAALGMGASRLQAVFHHVLPLAMPGILTGTIIAMARALGETAPLLLVGMNAFVTEAPKGLLDSAAVLPVQIYIWADRPERGFAELTSAAILILLAFLILMNGAAIWLRRKFERRW